MNLKLTVDGQTYTVEIEDLDQRPIRARIGAEVFEVWPETPASPPAPVAATNPAPPQPATPPARVEASANAVLAPLPGVLVAIAVQPGEAVTVGQPLCVLEAMKMRNTLRAARAGRITAIHAAVGQAVAHQQRLMEFGPETP